MSENFWKNLEKPIVGMAPMDGITDAAFRRMLCKYSEPSFVMTEFVNVEGLARGAMKMLPAFYYGESERPVVAQIFGVEVESFYKAAVLVCAMGFDGVDINMGCPVKKVTAKGSGAGLIKTPGLAREIILAVKRGVADWAGGIGLEEAGIHGDLIGAIERLREDGKFGEKMKLKNELVRCAIPVSVKTRTGYAKAITEEWVGQIIEAGVNVICLHGRTLKQMYGGEADWEEVGKAAGLCRKAGVLLIGNGDVKSMEDAMEKIEKYGVDGIMVGRAAMGKPWFFGGKEPDLEAKIEILLEHVRVFGEVFGEGKAFHEIKKHLACYLKGFDGAREMRAEIMHAENEKDVITILRRIF